MHMSTGPVLSRNQLDKVICQLKFNPQFSIDKMIGEFQSRIANEYPNSGQTVEPQIPVMPNAPFIMNYSFSSSDGAWTVNVTNSFIAFTSSRYASWDEFSSRLSAILRDFNNCYGIDHFARVGLRFINAFRISRLVGSAEESPPFKDLFRMEALGASMLFGDGVENYSSTVDACYGSHRVRSITGFIRFNDDGERGFLIDNDMYTLDVTGYADVMTTLDRFDRDSYELLNSMITDRMRRLLE